MAAEHRPPTAPQETVRKTRPPFMKLLDAQADLGNFVSVGLDSDREELPNVLGYDPHNTAGRKFTNSERLTIARFNEKIVDKTHEFAAAYKPNFAFYVEGNALDVLARTIRYINRKCPEKLVILDAKFGDIGNTAKKYAKYVFDELGADAVTINPYMGRIDSAEEFLKYKDRGVIPIVRTSNEGARETQDVIVKTPEGEIPYYLFMAKLIAREWNGNGNVMMVAGATNPKELGRIRAAVGDISLLIPGVGKQGGSASEVVPLGKNSRGRGILINSSRGIIFASKEDDFAIRAGIETQKLNNEIRLSLAA